MERDVLYVPESNIQDSEFEDGEQDEEEIEGEEQDQNDEETEHDDNLEDGGEKEWKDDGTPPNTESSLKRPKEGQLSIRYPTA